MTITEQYADWCNGCWWRIQQRGYCHTHRTSYYSAVDGKLPHAVEQILPHPVPSLDLSCVYEGGLDWLSGKDSQNNFLLFINERHTKICDDWLQGRVKVMCIHMVNNRNKWFIAINLRISNKTMTSYDKNISMRWHLTLTYRSRSLPMLDRRDCWGDGDFFFFASVARDSAAALHADELGFSITLYTLWVIYRLIMCQAWRKTQLNPTLWLHSWRQFEMTSS